MTAPGERAGEADDPAGGPARASGYRSAELDRHVGERLRALRVLSGATLGEVAARLGLTFQQVRKYETGENRASAGLLLEVADHHDLPVAWLYGAYADPTRERRGWDAYARVLDLLQRAGSASEGGRERGVAAAGAALRLVAGASGGGGGSGVAPGEDADPPDAEPGGSLPWLRRALRGPDAAFLEEAARRMAVAPAGPVLAPFLGAWPTPPARAPVSPPRRAAGAGPRVLLVDDDPDVRLTVGRQLASAGFRVVEAGDGDEALRFAGSAAGCGLSAVVTDYAMPGMDGVALMAALAGIRPGLPGLVITGFASAPGLADLPPGTAVLRKPFRRMELVGRLRLLLPPPPAGATEAADAPRPVP